MNLYIRELTSGYKTLITWIISLSGVIFFMLSIYPTFSNQEAQFDALMEGFPPEVLRAFGLSDFNFGNLLHFLGYILSFIFLAASIFSIHLGSDALAKEEIDKTSEFLLTKPISRFKIVTFKLLSSITMIFIFTILFFSITTILLEFVKERPYNIQTLFTYCIAMLLIQILFLGIGCVISVVVNHAKSVPSITLGTVFGLYGLSLIAGILNDKPWLNYLTPFRYFDTLEIAKKASLQVDLVILSLFIFLFCIIITYYYFLKRDITA